MAAEGVEAAAEAQPEAGKAAAGQPPAKRPRTDGGPGAPPLFSAGGYVQAGDGWWAHSGGKWLHNKQEGAYFHLPTGQLRVVLEDADAGSRVEAAEKPAEASKEAAKEAAEEALPDEGPLLRGRVRWFNKGKGFGFIEPLDEAAVAVLENKDVFVHRNQIMAGPAEGEAEATDEQAVFASLEAGAMVTFRLGQTDNGRVCAVKVCAAEDEVADAEDAEDGEDEGDEEEEDEDAADGAASEASSVEIDLEEELKCGSHQDKGEGKETIEDFLVDKLKLPVNVLGETATCLFFGVFDGHGGPYCAEHVSTHLAKNVLARMRDRAKQVSDEVALKTALLGGFKQTEHNYIQHAKKTDDSSGSTACTMMVFGPDDQMRLRLFMANCGDSRAVLCRAGGVPLRLTEDHKPNLPAEKKRIEAADGGVVEIAGVWRAVLPAKKRLTSKIAGLAVSRSFGDKDFKGPDIVSAEPEITIHEVDWEGDEFVILATDGIWDVLSDKDSVALVRHHLQAGKNEQKAAEALVKRAKERGTKDDCTAMVVRFGWNAASGGSSKAADGAEEKPDAAAGAQQKPAAAAEATAQDEDEDGEEGEEEELDDDEETEALAKMAAAMAANTGAVVGPTGEDSEDDEDAATAAMAAAQKPKGEDRDIFAEGETEEQDEEAAGLKRWDAAQPSGPAALGPLFEGLGPTREELQVTAEPVAGPTLISGGLLKGLGADKPEEAKEDAAPAESKDAVDADMDMFG